MWPVWKSVFSFGVYFSDQASSWFAGSSAELAHRPEMLTSCIHNRWPLGCSAPRGACNPWAGDTGGSYSSIWLYKHGYHGLCFIAILFSCFLLHISQYSNAHCPFDLESFHGGHQVCTQEVIPSHGSPSCKPLCVPRLPDGILPQVSWLWINYTSLQCVKTNSLCLKISDQNLDLKPCLRPLDAAVGHHQSRQHCSNYYQLS